MGLFGFKSTKERTREEWEREKQVNPHLHDMIVKKGRYVISTLQPIAEKKGFRMNVKEPNEKRMSEGDPYVVEIVQPEAKTHDPHQGFLAHVRLDVLSKNQEVFYAYVTEDSKYLERHAPLSKLEYVCRLLQSTLSKQ
jgi:hypothetical protein